MPYVKRSNLKIEEMLTEEENKKKKGIDGSSETKIVSISALETKMSDDPKAAPNLLDELEEKSRSIRGKTGRIKGHQTTHLTSTRRRI